MDKIKLTKSRPDMSSFRKVILFIDFSRGYSRSLMRGIVRYSTIHGPWVFYPRPLFFQISEDSEQEIERILKWKPDGLITRAPEVTKKLTKAGIPTIIAISTNEEYPDIAQLSPNPESIGHMAAEYLLNMGFTNYAYCGFHGQRWSIRRGESFCEFIKQNGFDTHFFGQSATNSTYMWDAEQKKLIEWLKTLPKPIGMMVCNDDCGQFVIEACKIAGLNVGYDIAILGVDNDDLVCELSSPSISSIALDSQRAGYDLGELLDEMMENPDIEVKKMFVDPLYVIQRKSTDILAIDDEDVFNAVRYIRNHSGNSISVGDVVKKACVSRRRLEQKFKKTLRRSIYSEIILCRMNKVSKLLLETNMSISKIASKMGFSEIGELSRIFKKTKGLSPREYRKIHSIKNGT